MLLSKSLYIRGLQCTKSLWLKIHQPSLLTKADQSQFETGNRVGLLTRQLFPGGREIPYTSPEEQIEKTKVFINSAVKTIYEATFEFDGVMVMLDILHRDEEGSLYIYEVKSSAKVKQTHKNDLSIQYYVLNGLGFNIVSSNLVYLNNRYVREEELDLNALFQINDISDSIIALQGSIPGKIQQLKEILDGTEPEVPIGKHCTTPYKCDAYDFCWRNIPELSIFTISGLSMKKKMALYSQGILTLDQIEDFTDFKKPQLIQIQSELSQEVYIEKKAISSFLSNLSYPIYHLDFESYQQAIPEWPGVNSFMNIPFQYSLHIEQENGDVEHREFLAIEGGDPRYKLAKNLIHDIPEDVTVLTYNMSFEKGIIKNLAELFPLLADHLMAINENVKDLMLPFKKKQYYSPAMKGRYSIKYVLPALVPEMTSAYKELDGIHNGMDAMTIFPKLVEMEDEERLKNRTALLKYCELDTLAMVRILEVLKSI